METFNSKIMKVAVLLFLTSSCVTGQQLQSLLIWPASGCGGAPTINVTDSGIHTFPTSSSTISHRTNGLWAIEVCNSATNVCFSRSTVSGTGTGCGSIPFPGGNNQIRVKRFGNDMQNEERITFFDETSLRGNEWIVSSPGADRPTSFIARSFFFTGANSWEHRSTVGTVGACLNHTLQGRTYGHTYQTSANFNITSVIHGCTGVTPPTTTTVTPTRPTATGPTVTGPTVTRPIVTTPRNGTGSGTINSPYIAVMLTVLSSTFVIY